MIALSASALSGCISASPEAVARDCEAQARTTTGISGQFGVGFDNEGPTIGKWELGINSSGFTGRDPYQVYDSCVREQTGQGPVRPPNLDG